MNRRIEELRQYILDKQHHRYRRSPEEVGLTGLNEEFIERELFDIECSAAMLSAFLEKEEPVILPGERILMTRTITAVPDIFTEVERNLIKENHFLHEKGYVCNISPDYQTTLQKGLGARRQEIVARAEDKDLNENQKQVLASMLGCLEAIQGFIGKYEKYAREQGETESADVLRVIREEGAQSFRQALQLLRALHFSLWAAGSYHNTLGRFDQYMYPFYKNDIEGGVITEEEAFDLVKEFFLSCNKDSDLYPGIQQGDNGQSMVLAGRAADGEYLFNELSEMCLRASYELNMIDPKINIRVDKNTPAKVFEMGSELTKIGLGFPQYSNDDIVIPGLVRKGYSDEDARNYVVAACWEFIIPGMAMDIPNIDALSLAGAVNNALPRLKHCPDYESFYREVEKEIARVAEYMHNRHRGLYMIPSPMMSLLMEGTVERAQDISQGAKYNNYGVHGTGIATAADSLAAIKKYYFEERTVDHDRLINALATDFARDGELQELLRNEAPKMGRDDDYVDSIATVLLDSFERAFEGRINERGGIYRTGTGTAMCYAWHADGLGATPDGRSAGEMLPANYSPSLFIKHKGPVSVIKSFTKQNLVNSINGGPLTLEFDQSIFNNAESVAKLGMLINTYIALGGHQIQLNTVSREKLLDAKIHPELHRNLIVRVWGWSGYFVELDECYQDHVISRIEFGL